MKKEKTITPAEQLLNDTIACLDNSVLDMYTSKGEDTLRLRGNIAALTELYKTIEESEAKKEELKVQKMGNVTNLICGLSSTIVSAGTTIGLTLSTFAYETVGQGSFFTTAGRAAISAALKNINKK